MLVKYSDFNKYYTFNTQNLKNKISKIYGNPLLSDLSNIMIRSIEGNCTLNNSQLIYLNDFHFEKDQKYKRAKIINEILIHNQAADVVFLLEGCEAGSSPDEYTHDTLIGKGLIDCDYHCFGWENMKLSNQSFALIKEIQKLNIELKCKYSSYLSLKEKKLQFFNNIHIDDFENQFEKIEGIEDEIKKLSVVCENMKDNIDSKYKKILDLSEKRNEYLYKTINKILEIRGDALIFVIGGEAHSNNIPQVFPNINHNIIRLKDCVKISNVDDALSEVYGDVNNTNDI